jgi:tRNA modification GTPase
MRAPSSYTGEDVVELHGHGGALSLARLLAAVVAAGAEVAEPGEFTRRAFCNGRMDLTRAEAVAAIIGARGERALRVAQANLSGALATRVRGLRERVTALLAELEARVDFPEEQLDFVPAERLSEEAAASGRDVRSLAGTWRQGRALTNGVIVALVGRPNVGKSSLFNALLGRERALVAADPGTTRDYLEAAVEWDGVAVTLVDTAGERAVAGVEGRGVELGRARAAQADVVVRVVDATDPVLEEGDVIALSKCDLKAYVDVGRACVHTSAVRGTGLEELRGKVLASAGIARGEEEPEGILTSERQYSALVEAGQALDRAATTTDSPELAALDARIALDRLGKLTGESVDEAVLDAIFARFCIGK